MLDKINLLSRARASHSRQQSVVVLPSPGGKNRVSMYRKQPQQRNGGQTSSKKSKRNSRNRSLTIYNPFNFNKEMVQQSQRFSSTRGTGGGVSQSVDFGAPLDMSATVNSTAPTAGGGVRNE